MIDTSSVTFPADTYRECINELSDHGMNERINLFEIIDQLFMLLLFGDVEFRSSLNTGRVRNVVTFRNCRH